jgi:hypothetical protein
VELAAEGDLGYLCLECLAERTIAVAQQNRMKNPALGYDPLLEARWRALLPVCKAGNVTLITNMGAANPLAALRKTKELAQEAGISGITIAAVTGDDVLDAVGAGDYTIDETGAKLADLGGRIVSANAYLGAAPIVEALEGGANVVLTGRVADPALFTAPMIFEFGWKMDDWKRLGAATGAGHLLECASQVSGGYYAEPGKKFVPDLARIGFPIAEVAEDGSFTLSKVAGSGGLIDRHTCTEQLLYELHDPAAYKTPDVVADFSRVAFTEKGKDVVEVRGFSGSRRPETLKVSIGYVDGYIGEGQISYGGPNAAARGALALKTVEERLDLIGLNRIEERYDLIGVNALHGPGISSAHPDPYEVRARVAVRTGSLREAVLVGNEVEALYVTGPAGGAGAFKSAREVVAVVSVFIPRDLVTTRVVYERL